MATLSMNDGGPEQLNLQSEHDRLAGGAATAIAAVRVRLKSESAEA